jgi:L-ribulose-5-phosphate 3-epimerase
LRRVDSVERPQIGVNLDDLRLSSKQAFQKASSLRFTGVEFSAIRGELSPENLSASGRRHLARFAGGLGLGIASLTADVPGTRLTDPLSVAERVDRTRQIIDLASDLGVPVVTTAAGALTNPETGEPSPIAVEALQLLGDFADSRGRLLAIRPTYDDGTRTASLLNAVGCPSVVVGMDPAALVMAGQSPLSVIASAAGRIPIMYARDGTVGGPERAGAEVPLGDGDVDMIGVIAALHASEYRGPYIVRRFDSATPVDDLLAARDRLLDFLPPGN